MRNKIIQEFDINLLNIKKDVELFDYEINDSFFKCFEQDIVQKGKLMVKAEVLKTHSLITINFVINGTIELECDRSLEIFDYPFQFKTSVYYKYGQEKMELDVNLFQIEENTVTLNISDFLMESILIEIPVKKIHPNFKDEQNNSEFETLYYQTQNNKEEEDNNTIDPRWEALKKIKK